MKYNFRIKLVGDSRPVSYRNIEVLIGSTGNLDVTPKGVRAMIRQYLKSTEKTIYKYPISFKYYKKSNGLDIKINGITGDEIRNLLPKFDQFTEGNAIRDVSQNYLISFGLRSLALLNGTPNAKPTPAPTQQSVPAPTQSQPQNQSQTMNNNYILTEPELEKIYGNNWRSSDKLDWVDEFDFLFNHRLTDTEQSLLKSGANLSIEIDGIDYTIPVEATTLACYHDYDDLSAEEIDEIIDALKLFESIIGISDQEKQSATELLEQLKLFKKHNK